jgi:diaminohydroxyphosphoribosylaminopyrimidine deaminase / 5-amino-6-(5-phosphoribosylamino)uracil reductase
MTGSHDDLRMMRAALALARRGLGNVWPNPAVGCIIAREGHAVGRGWTQPGGRPHAEAEALARAGEAARGAIAYVTLEPCCHWGKTPPCADALIAAGIKRVVAATDDPDPRVAGSGLARLREAGVSLETGLCAAEAAEINAGFFQRVHTGRPLVTLKLAASLDGRIAAASGESRWITGDGARERAHLLRAEHDAVMVGSGTALADDPQLTCRLPGLTGRSPIRIVIDSQLHIPATARLVAAARQHPTWVVTTNSADPNRQAALRAAEVEVITAQTDACGHVDLSAALGLLGERGLTRVLVDGGARLAAALLRAGLIDRLVWMGAPMLIGGDGIPAIANLGLDGLADAPRFEHVATEVVGGDVVSHFRAPR